MTRWRLWILPLPAALLAAACGLGGEARPEPATGPALWVGARSAPLTASDLARLERAGLRQLYLEAGTLDWSGGRPTMAPAPMPRAPRRFPVTLVVSGASPAGADPVAAADVAAALARLRIETEGQGWIPVGVHLDLLPAEEAAPDDGTYAEWLAALGDALDRRISIAATIERGTLGDDASAQRLADALDSILVVLYGVRPGEPESRAAWDLQTIDPAIEALEALEIPYRVGIVTLGMAFRAGTGAAPEGATEVSLGALARNPAFQLEHGSSLQAFDRQLHEFQATQQATAGPWSVRPGERIRVVRTSPGYLQEVARRIAARNPARYLGPVFYRLRGDEERLSMTLQTLAGVLAGESPRPDLGIETEREGGGITVAVTNRSETPTELSLFDNCLELTAEQGTFGAVEPGGFWRYALFQLQKDGAAVRTYRAANRLHLCTPYLEGGERIESGRIDVLRQGREARMRVGGMFLLPEGEVLRLPEQELDL